MTHEGTSEVKETRVRMLEQKFHNFKMIPDESIDSLFSRFADIANPLKSLGSEIPLPSQISKILYALKGSVWVQKRTSIEESHNFKKMTFEGLMGKLKAFEEQMKQLDEDNEHQISLAKVEVKTEKTEKSLAFKALKIVEDSSSEDEDDVDVVLYTRGFNIFLKFNKRKTGNVFGNKSILGTKKNDPFLDAFDATPRSI